MRKIKKTLSPKKKIQKKKKLHIYMYMTEKQVIVCNTFFACNLRKETKKSIHMDKFREWIP